MFVAMRRRRFLCLIYGMVLMLSVNLGQAATFASHCGTIGIDIITFPSMSTLRRHGNLQEEGGGAYKVFTKV